MKQVYTKLVDLISQHLSNRDFTLMYASSNRIKTNHMWEVEIVDNVHSLWL